jgi:hypothetical protein
VGGKPLCFYGGAFPQSLRDGKVSGDFLLKPNVSPPPPQRRGSEGDREVSVCSFNSDFLGEGVVEGNWSIC